MLDKLKEVQARYNDINKEIVKPEVINNQELYAKLTKEHSDLQPIVEQGKEYIQVCEKIEEDKEVLNGNDEELIELVNMELDELEERKEKMEEKLKFLLLPKDPNDDKNVIIELRAGTGGDEAALF